MIRDAPPAKERRESLPPRTGRSGKAPTLKEIQESFQRAVIDGDDAILALIPDNSRTGRGTLLGVYRHAYVGRLVDVTGSDYELLQAYMGEETFDTMARAYVRAHPSHTPNVRWFSRSLPDFLSATEPYRSHPELAEMAALERALNDAFDAPDAPVLTIGDLRSVPPESWGSLSFTPHPSAARLVNTTNAFAIWLALKDEKEPPTAAKLPEREVLLVWRDDTMPRVRELGPEEAMMWTEAAKGVSFGVLCEMAATFDDPDNAAVRAAQYLHGWLAKGALSGYSTAQRQKRARAPQ
jgi:hypothetical protein